jgi:hypothetical protein
MSDSKRASRRFIINASESTSLGTTAKIIVDRQTGVQYLYAAEGYGGGLTALLDRDGKPLLAAE